MKVLVCGTCLPRCFESRLRMLSVAGNQYQNNLIKALRETNDVEVLSYIGIPRELPDEILKQAALQDGYSPILANNKFIALISYRKHLRAAVNNADIIICYNSMFPWFGVGKMASRKGKKTVLVLADYTPASEVKKFARKLYSICMKKDFSRYRKVVLLSDGSKKYVTDVQDAIVINGCLDNQKFIDFQEKRVSNTKRIVYTGGLSKVTGVDLLLEAFTKIKDSEYQLIICGQGEELVDLIRQYCERDSRIIFRGLVSNDEYIDIINSADVLVNPRNMNYEQNANNFPSKILEYLASGRNIVSTYFKGFEAYTKYITFVPSDVNSIQKGICNCLENNEDVYEVNRTFARSFIWENQIDKFL